MSGLKFLISAIGLLACLPFGYQATTTKTSPISTVTMVTKTSIASGMMMTNATIMASTTQQPTTTEKVTTMRPTTTEKVTTMRPTTTEKVTTMRPTTTEKVTTMKPTTTEKVTTMQPTTTEKVTTMKPTTTDKVTTASTTPKQTTTSGTTLDPSLVYINNKLVKLIDKCQVGVASSCPPGSCCTRTYLNYPAGYSGLRIDYQLQCKPFRAPGEFCYYNTPENFCPCASQRCRTNGFYGYCL